MAETTLVVMAAGIGSRYGGLKQIDPVGPCGEKIIDYSVYDAKRAGFDKVLFVIRKEIESDFREHIGQTIEQQIDTDYVFQELDALPARPTRPAGSVPPASRSKPWGPGHAVFVCREAVTTPFAVINADDFYGASSFKMLCDYLKAVPVSGGVSDYCLVGYILKNTLSEHGHVARGVCTATNQGFLKEIHERLKIQPAGDRIQYRDDAETWVEISGESIVSMNIWGFTPSLFAELESRLSDFLEKHLTDINSEFLLPVVVGDQVNEGKARVKILRSTEKWFGVTYPQDKPLVTHAVRKLIDRGSYPHSLWGEIVSEG